MNLKAIIQYSGKNYNGYSRQDKKPTIEAALEKALIILLKRKPAISVAGRTDAGVHAIGQVISFKANVGFSSGEMRYRLNSILPSDIQVRKIQKVDDVFDARCSAVARQYVYYILNRRYPSVVHDDYCFTYAKVMDMSEMKKAAKCFLGVHNFKAFAASGAEGKLFVREILSFKVENKSDFFDVANKGYDKGNGEG